MGGHTYFEKLLNFVLPPLCIFYNHSQPLFLFPGFLDSPNCFFFQQNTKQNQQKKQNKNKTKQNQKSQYQNDCIENNNNDIYNNNMITYNDENTNNQKDDDMKDESKLNESNLLLKKNNPQSAIKKDKTTLKNKNDNHNNIIWEHPIPANTEISPYNDSSKSDSSMLSPIKLEKKQNKDKCNLKRTQTFNPIGESQTKLLKDSGNNDMCNTNHISNKGCNQNEMPIQQNKLSISNKVMPAIDNPNNIIAKNNNSAHSSPSLIGNPMKTSKGQQINLEEIPIDLRETGDTMSVAGWINTNTNSKNKDIYNSNQFENESKDQEISMTVINQKNKDISDRNDVTNKNKDKRSVNLNNERITERKRTAYDCENENGGQTEKEDCDENEMKESETDYTPKFKSKMLNNSNTNAKNKDMFLDNEKSKSMDSIESKHQLSQKFGKLEMDEMIDEEREYNNNMCNQNKLNDDCMMELSENEDIDNNNECDENNNENNDNLNENINLNKTNENWINGMNTFGKKPTINATAVIDRPVWQMQSLNVIPNCNSYLFLIVGCMC